MLAAWLGWLFPQILLWILRRVVSVWYFVWFRLVFAFWFGLSGVLLGVLVLLIDVPRALDFCLRMIWAGGLTNVFSVWVWWVCAVSRWLACASVPYVWSCADCT